MIKNHNHKIYLDILRKMTPEKRLLKAFELSEYSKKLFIQGMRMRFSDLNEDDFKKLLYIRLNKCHNRNY